MGLTLEEKGAYSLCLDLIYSHGGPIADDARWIAGICGVSLRKWSVLRERLIATGKLVAVSGRLSNERADKELIISAETARNLSESGAKGGRKAAENRSASNKNNELEVAPLQPIEKIREDKKEPLRGPLAEPTKSLEADVYRYGKDVLGDGAGGVITNLRKACEYDNAHAMDWLKQAAEKQNPMEWLQAVLRATKDRAYRGVEGAPKHSAPVIENKQTREEIAGIERMRRSLLKMSPDDERAAYERQKAEYAMLDARRAAEAEAMH